MADCIDAQFSASLERAQDSARQLGSGAEHTSQTAKELLEEGNNNKINCNIHRASGRVCLLLPFSCGETCKMASRLHYNIANTHCSFNSELGQSPDGIRLEIFKQRNENLPYRKLYFESGRKFSFLSFKISFNNALFSFFCDTFLSFVRKKEKEMNV